MIIVSVEDGLSLGLMIRGGAEYGLGIYITGVDESSAADLAGLQSGYLFNIHPFVLCSKRNLPQCYGNSLTERNLISS
ncbi:hypothetical protein NPIL_428571 [Nephila pilipes]|uniref:Uncharacterized protein n=1 Tax=Nephila pilipes TaxID=299642 RepID=A0A8X6NJC5_NEPPI|nr:hypothetical protein NPIL_428571 [Nephila pilipes]